MNKGKSDPTYYFNEAFNCAVIAFSMVPNFDAKLLSTNICIYSILYKEGYFDGTADLKSLHAHVLIPFNQLVECTAVQSALEDMRIKRGYGGNAAETTVRAVDCPLKLKIIAPVSELRALLETVTSFTLDIVSKKTGKALCVFDDLKTIQFKSPPSFADAPVACVHVVDTILYVGNISGSMSVWDINTGTCLSQHIIFQDGMVTSMTYCDNNLFILCTVDKRNCAVVWNTTHQQIFKILEYDVRALAASSRYVYGIVDNAILIWDSRDYEVPDPEIPKEKRAYLLQTFMQYFYDDPKPTNDVPVLVAKEKFNRDEICVASYAVLDKLTSVLVYADGRLYAGRDDGSVRAYDANTGALLQILDSTHRAPVLAVAFSINRVFVIVYQSIVLFDTGVEPPAVVCTVPLHRILEDVSNLAIHVYGRYIYVSNRRLGVYIYEIVANTLNFVKCMEFAGTSCENSAITLSGCKMYFASDKGIKYHLL